MYNRCLHNSVLQFLEWGVNMQEFIEFFEKNLCGYLATTEGNMPRVRPWSFLFFEDGKFWFLTTNNKRVFKQLQENPYIEFCSCSSDSIHCRLSGKIEFCNDLNIKNRVLTERPILKEIYENPENPVLESFYLEHGTLSKYSSKFKINRFIEF